MSRGLEAGPQSSVGWITCLRQHVSFSGCRDARVLYWLHSSYYFKNFEQGVSRSQAALPASMAPRPVALPPFSYFLILEVEGVLCQVQHVGSAMPNPPALAGAPSEAEYHPKRRSVFGEYTLYCRPHLREFLRALANRFHLAVWTRLPYGVAKPVVDFLFRGINCRLHVLALENCISIVERRPPGTLCKCPPRPRHSEYPCPAHPNDAYCDPDLEEDAYFQFPEHPEGRLRLKVLHRGVWDRTKFRGNQLRANSTNTLLIDSSPESSILNPRDNAIFPFPYVGGEHDSTLNGSLRSYLRGLLGSGLSVPQYVSRNAYFGVLTVPLRHTPLALRVHACLPYLDPSLILRDADFLHDYSALGHDHFIPHRPADGNEKSERIKRV